MTKFLLPALLAIFLLPYGCSSSIDLTNRLSGRTINNKTELTKKSHNYDFKKTLKKKITIALLLPFSAPDNSPLYNASLAIYRAFMHRISSSKKGIKVLKVNTYDQDITTIYDDSVKKGADIVVGPLLKSNAIKLLNYDLKVPTVVLNEVVPIDENNGNENLFQFSLSFKMEAIEVALRANQEGFKNALVLYHSNKWGNEIVQEFMKQWISFGGTISNAIGFNSKSYLPNVISSLVGVSKHQISSYNKYVKIKKYQEKKSVRDNTPYIDPIEALNEEEKEEFLQEISRKYEADFIYMVANYDYARQIKPLLSFYLSNDLRVYSTKQINKIASTSSISSNIDLNFITFADLPWSLGSTKFNSVRQQLRTLYGNKIFDEYSRFYAMGYDLLNIVRLVQLKSDSKTSRLTSKYYINGATGKITLNEDGVFIRQSSWGKFMNGKLIMLKKIEPYQPKERIMKKSIRTIKAMR
jgi:outer membrane PBP1 activator LpoA protein